MVEYHRQHRFDSFLRFHVYETFSTFKNDQDHNKDALVPLDMFSFILALLLRFTVSSSLQSNRIIAIQTTRKG